jgi:hypothetical protein
MMMANQCCENVVDGGTHDFGQDVFFRKIHYLLEHGQALKGRTLGLTENWSGIALKADRVAPLEFAQMDWKWFRSGPAGDSLAPVIFQSLGRLSSVDEFAAGSKAFGGEIPLSLRSLILKTRKEAAQASLNYGWRTHLDDADPRASVVPCGAETDPSPWTVNALDGTHTDLIWADHWSWVFHVPIPKIAGLWSPFGCDELKL